MNVFWRCVQNRCYGKYDFFLQGLPRKLSDLILRKTVPTVYMTHCPVDFISPDFVLRKTIPTIYMAHCPVDFISPDFVLRKTIPTTYMAHCPVDFVSPDFVL
ncbi:hypothetical protein, partial [Escherichia coli]|uniref:hypothetical protein n=1 Tax=Escherichia coli TaxID=562 RepID=UPI003F775226